MVKAVPAPAPKLEMTGETEMPRNFPVVDGLANIFQSGGKGARGWAKAVLALYLNVGVQIALGPVQLQFFFLRLSSGW